MKQLLLLTAFFGCFALASLQAQHCPYSSSSENCARVCPEAAAAKAAAADVSIVKRVVQETGKASYVRKQVCPSSGQASYVPVEFCSKSGKFINVSPREKTCIKSKAASDKGTATKVSAEAGSRPAHCTDAQKAACARACAGSKAAASSSAAKLVKNKP